MAFPALSVRVHRRRFVRSLICIKFHMFEIPDACYSDVKRFFFSAFMSTICAEH